MKLLTPNDLESRSADLIAENIEQLRALFPEAFIEGKIDFAVLKQLLGGAVDEREEKYGLNWHGKRRARQLAITPSTGTLRPCPEESVDWDTTQNLMIEGDNLEVLKLLQKSYAGKVKLIYIDPPYNTGKDFVYPDDFRDNIRNYLELTGQVGEEGRKLSSNTEASGRFHTDWLNMIYPRLKLAHSLLDDDGVLFVSIDDGEVNHLKTICNELFGEENFLAVLIWNKQHSQQQGMFKRYHEYVVVYARDATSLDPIAGGEGEIDAGAIKKISRANPASEFVFPAGVRFDAPDGIELHGTYGGSEQVTVVSGRLVSQDGRTVEPVTLRAGWTQKRQMQSWFAGQETYDTRGQRIIEFYFNSAGKLKCRKERSRVTPSSFLPEYGMVSEQTRYLDALMGAHVFSNPKPVQMMSDFIGWFVGENEIVLDFFAGSGTTAEGVWRRNVSDGNARRFISVQLPEPLHVSDPEQEEAVRFCEAHGIAANIAELTKERLRRAAKKILLEQPNVTSDLGFRVFKLDSSNIRAWNPDRDNLEQTLLDHMEHLVPGRTEADILYELLLKLGLDLCVPIERRTIAGKTVHSIGGGVLLVCLAESIDRSEVEGLARGMVEWHEALSPAGDTTCVFRDSAFADDVVKTNLAAILQQHGLTHVRSL
jgi:adenine-specific DNA-methyltransferase